MCIRDRQICRAALKAVDSADYKILPYIPYPDICLEGLKKFGMSFVDKFEIFASIAPEVMTGELALHGDDGKAWLIIGNMSMAPGQKESEQVECTVLNLRNGEMLSLIHIFERLPALSV